jgi:hypothetical protein
MLGITSVIFFFVFLFLNEGVAVEIPTPSGMDGIISLFVMGIIGFFLVGLSTLGTVFGIAGIRAKERKRTFAVWGLALSAAMILIYVGSFMQPLILWAVVFLI